MSARLLCVAKSEKHYADDDSRRAYSQYLRLLTRLTRTNKDEIDQTIMLDYKDYHSLLITHHCDITICYIFFIRTMRIDLFSSFDIVCALQSKLMFRVIDTVL